MKLIWSPEMASKAYIDTVASCKKLHKESGVAELVSAMAAGWNTRLIVETWSSGGATATSIGLAVASHHTGGRHVCIVPDHKSKSEYMEALGETDENVEVVVGEPEEGVEELTGIDFMVVDCRSKDFDKILRSAKLGARGAVLVCKNASSRMSLSFRWRSVLDAGSRRLVRSAFLPVGRGLDIAYVASISGSSSTSKGKSRWIKHVDQKSGEEIVIRK
ncbi:uncharacterized protein LOC115746487 [Rhodamnia argentea]|uniref:Uncharacterized protein LOC115746487 n=1 Tax=Rhodamnia argentea TaxID=178133 RepID=A0A8B8PTM8_9MYRT|nr:uncharacterized protein LOC115746487 [Rhodamnia argentea]